MERQKVLLSEKLDADIISGQTLEGETVFAILFVRKGMLIGEKIHALSTENKEEAFEAIMREYYLESKTPITIITKETLSNFQVWKRILPHIEIREPFNQQLYDLCVLAERKALEKLKERISSKKITKDLLETAKEALGLRRVPKRIEGYDISNIFGKEAVGSMVVFINGEREKSEYRRFKIKHVRQIDDYAMQREVLKRRFSHKEWDMPDLIVIDGGIGHLKSALSVMKELGINVDVIAISKGEKEDEIWSEKGKINIESNHPVKFLIQRVRDESHRFAISYHKNLRKKEAFSSFLDSIEGIGIKRKEKILKSISSLEELKNITPESLAQRCGIPISLARTIIENAKRQCYS